MTHQLIYESEYPHKTPSKKFHKECVERCKTIFETELNIAIVKNAYFEKRIYDKKQWEWLFIVDLDIFDPNKFLKPEQIDSISFLLSEKEKKDAAEMDFQTLQ